MKQWTLVADIQFQHLGPEVVSPAASDAGTHTHVGFGDRHRAASGSIHRARV